MARTANDLVTQYIAETFASNVSLPVDPEQMSAVVQSAQQLNKLGMQISAAEGALLRMLVTVVQGKKIVELGTLVGYSTIWLADGVGEQGQVYTVDNNPQHVQIAQKNFAACGYQDRITTILAEGIEGLAQLESHGPFDMVFIDADKGSYLQYAQWADQYLRVGGLLVADNSLLFGAVPHGELPQDMNVSRNSWQVMREFNRWLADNPNYHSMLLPTEEGLTVGVKLA